MALLTRDELFAFRTRRDPNALLRAYLDRWANHLELAIDIDDAVSAAVDACFGNFVYNSWIHSRSAKLVTDPSDCVRTRLCLLQMGVVPETAFGADPEVVAARSQQSEPDGLAIECIAYELASSLKRYLQLTEAEARLRVGGPSIVGERLRRLPAVMLPFLKSTYDAESWVWLYHFGVTEVLPPNFDSRELWDRLPNDEDC